MNTEARVSVGYPKPTHGRLREKMLQIFFSIILGFGLYLFAGKLFAQPRVAYYTYYVNDDIIHDVLCKTRSKVHDRDGDGKVNCIDYTITFKQQWDKVMPPSYCEIVRNRNTGGRSDMNHLFVRIRLTSSGQWLYIEPQARSNKYNYKMSDFWGYPRYDPQYNNYGETSYWLGECRR